VTDVQAELARLEAAALILARRHNALEKQLRRVGEQAGATAKALLELDATLRRSGVLDDGDWALSLAPLDENPDRQSADDRSTIHDS
jgi:uncharacterized protein with von Willebrand factor type A (vWA) domain